MLPKRLKKQAMDPILCKADSHDPERCANISDAPNWKQPPMTISGGRSDGQQKLPLKAFEDSLRALGIMHCENTTCKARLSELLPVAPQCCWDPFRSWALVVVSCYRPDQWCRSLWGARYECSRLYSYFANGGPDTWAEYQTKHRDWFGIWQVAFWVSSNVGLNNGAEILRSHVELDQPQVRTAINKLSSFEICQRRLWNFVLTCERRLMEAPEIVVFLDSSKKRIKHDSKHSECTPELCYFDDDNTTKVEQIHKCNGVCGTYKFEPNGNNIEGSGFQSTAWHISDLSRPEGHVEVALKPQYERYMAVSHVWSDGTGAGSKQPGEVNKCLVDFFRQFALNDIEPLAIWWDTISMPVDREQRARAIDRMHDNYKNAVFTLVHDKELIDFEWKDDGSPCVALVLSTWFSRGWTALELQQSKSVKVLFRNPDAKTDRPFVMKDLDNDILAKSDDPSTHLAHRAATNMIKKVRKNLDEYSALHYVVATIKSRYTSWARDRLIIAGLMLNIDIQSNWPKDQITKSVLQTHNKLWIQALLHGKPTMRRSGSWSWCPVSFLDFAEPAVSSYSSVDSNGEIVGNWTCKSARDAEILELVYSQGCN